MVVSHINTQLLYQSELDKLLSFEIDLGKLGRSYEKHKSNFDALQHYDLILCY